MGHRQRQVALKRDCDPKDDDAHSEGLSEKRLSRQEAPVPQRIKMSDELTQPARPPIHSLLAPRTVQADSPKFRSPCCLSPAAAYETQHTLFPLPRTAQPATSPRKRNNPAAAGATCFRSGPLHCHYPCPSPQDLHQRHGRTLVSINLALLRSV